MVASSTLLALLSTLVASSAAKDYLCGKNNNQERNALRGASLNYGDNTSPLEHPWLVQLVYADNKRECAGSLITVRHVLTARRCVDGVKPEDISVVFGPRTPYGGNASVKSAKSPSDANADLAVLELTKAVEISDFTIPVCVGDTFDENVFPEYRGLHYGPRNKSEENELSRAMYQDALWRKEDKECIEALGKDYNKDTQLCVGKWNQVFAEGIYTGGPILLHDDSRGRYLQVGIALKADAENNRGSATRVPLYQKEIIELTECALTGAGIDGKPSRKPGCDKVKTTTTKAPETTKKATTKKPDDSKNNYKKITKKNYGELGYDDILEFRDNDDITIKLTIANKDKTKDLAIKLTDKDTRLEGLLAFDVEYGVNPKCLNKTLTKFHFGEQFGAWSPHSPYFRVMMMVGHGDTVTACELGKEHRITVDPKNSGEVIVICGGEHSRTTGAIINSVESKGTTFYTPQFSLDTWKETPSGCTKPEKHFVKITMHNAELWTKPEDI